MRKVKHITFPHCKLPKSHREPINGQTKASRNLVSSVLFYTDHHISVILSSYEVIAMRPTFANITLGEIWVNACLLGEVISSVFLKAGQAAPHLLLRHATLIPPVPSTLAHATLYHFEHLLKKETHLRTNYAKTAQKCIIFICARISDC
jgi:hypothetical protein